MPRIMTTEHYYNSTEEGPHSLFSPTVALPCQLREMRAWENAGERRLAKAILEDALIQFYKHRARATTRQRHLHDEVRVWLTSDDETYIFSFVCICRLFSIDPQAARKMIFADDFTPIIVGKTSERRYGRHSD